MTTKLQVKVYHTFYGCDTGCCGHTVAVSDGDTELHHKYMWECAIGQRTPEEVKAWARRLAEQVLDAEWPECLASIDWDTLDVSEVSSD